MPELPEVETLRTGLEKYLVGHKIEDVEVKNKRIFSGDPKDVIGAKIIDVKRFGKGLVIDLSNNYSLAIHIKLTGQLIYRNKELGLTNQGKDQEVPTKSTHVIFTLDKSGMLYYNDIRQFGWIKVVKTADVQNLSFFKELGPEFLKDLSEEKFAEILSKSKVAIKPVIMDQQRMAGVGNIYANDALYLAKISPKRPAQSLSQEEVKELYKAILQVLKKGLEEGGSSELTYVNVLGKKGNYQNHTLIYGRDGQKCKRDGAIIEKIFLGGRGTYFCPKCQN